MMSSWRWKQHSVTTILLVFLRTISCWHVIHMVEGSLEVQEEGNSENECVLAEECEVEDLEDFVTEKGLDDESNEEEADWEEEDVEEEDWSPWDYPEEEQTRDLIIEGLDCHRILFEEVRPIPTLETWALMRQAYLDVVESPKNITRDNIHGPGGYLVKVKVAYSDGKGRGIFADEDIAKGTHVYDDGAYSAAFATATEFRRFLERLPDEYACDILSWAYVQRMHVDKQNDGTCVSDADTGSTCSGDSMIVVELDEAALINTAMSRNQDNNLDVESYAKRDISAGEELFQDYFEYADTEGWERDFGL